MANYEQKNGHFTVWVNDKYTKGGNQPYAKGKGKDLQGNEIEVTLWIPKSDKIKGFNLTMSKPYQKLTEAAQTSQDIPQSISEEPGNSLPF
jgi:hypothetical protein